MNVYLKGQVSIVNATIGAPGEDEIYFDGTVRQIKIILIANGLHMRFEIAPTAAFDVRQNGLCK